MTRKFRGVQYLRVFGGVEPSFAQSPFLLARPQRQASAIGVPEAKTPLSFLQ
jgi:hypothetical protein